ncbi:hypothetical protein KAI92_03785 [Candidatus Parcubacteria bacterium]|nr:hypothetical protein [Candidatus Parcubacteria bacterium]
MELNQLMEVKETVEKHCVKKLAQILYACIECPGERAEIDWITAKNYIDKNIWVVDTITMDLIDDRKNHQARNFNFGNQTEINPKFSFKRFDQLFGQYIWEKCHKEIRANLPNPPYKRIKFY